MSDNLAKIPLNGFKVEAGGVGFNLSFESLEQEIKRMGVVKEGEIFSQVNVSEQGLTFYVKKEEEKVDSG